MATMPIILNSLSWSQFGTPLNNWMTSFDQVEIDTNTEYHTATSWQAPDGRQFTENIFYWDWSHALAKYAADGANPYVNFRYKNKGTINGRNVDLIIKINNIGGSQAPYNEQYPGVMTNTCDRITINAEWRLDASLKFEADFESYYVWSGTDTRVGFTKMYTRIDDCDSLEGAVFPTGTKVYAITGTFIRETRTNHWETQRDDWIAAGEPRGDVIAMIAEFPGSTATLRLKDGEGVWWGGVSGAVGMVEDEGGDPEPGPEPEPEPVTYTITTSASPAGAGYIDPTVTVKEGTNKTIFYKANYGYHIKSITVDGTNVSVDQHPNFYKFENIQANHTINVVFESNAYNCLSEPDEDDCTVCDSLVETAPDIKTYGDITPTMCTSLQNDTGLNPQNVPLHNDGEDLDLLNDCLIGRPESDLERYESCEWRKFMHKFLPNLHTMFKAAICALCGLWANVHNITDDLAQLWEWVIGLKGCIDTTDNLQADIDRLAENVQEQIDEVNDRIDDLCGLLNQQMNQNMDTYGILTGTGWGDVTAFTGGEINTISGSPALLHPNTDYWDGVGFWYKKSSFLNCDGEVKTYEWFQPYLREYSYNTQVAFNDCIYKCPVSKLREWGWTDSLISTLTNFPQWWQGYCVSWGEYFTSTLYARIINDYLEIWVIGGSDSNLSGHVINGATKAPMLWIS